MNGTADDDLIDQILHQGKEEDTDEVLRLIQRIVETKIPMIPYARLGGANGLRMTRAAFAVMRKFSDLLEDFMALADAVAMQASLEDDDTTKDKNLIAVIKQHPLSDVIIRRWESALRMRQWINEKKQTVANKIEKQVTAELRTKKADQKKKEEELKQKEEEQKA